MKRRSPETKAALAVAIVTALVFLPSVTGTFVFDDRPLIVENEYVQAWHWVSRAFTTHFWDVSLYEDAREMRGTAEFRQYYRPLVTLSYLVNWMLGEGKAWTFHLVNTLIHAAVAGLATRAAIRWTRSIRLGIACGAVFALHPSRTENVTWVSGRTDLMMLLFVFLALEAFRAFERGRPPRAFGAFALGIAALVCAVLSKEPGALVVVLALVEREARPANRRPWLVPAVTGAIGIAYVLGRAVFWPPEGEVTRHFTPAHFFMTIGAYTGRALVPWPPTMYTNAIESDPSGAFVYSKPLIALGVAVLAASAYAAFVAWRRARVAFWLIVATYAFIGPLLNLYFTGTNVSASDRFLYAPLFFGVTALAVLFRAPLVRIARRRVAVAVFAGAVLAATFVIEIRTLDYRTEEAFWLAELAENPHHPYALENLGAEAAARGDLADAYRYFTRAEEPEALRFRLAGGEARQLKAHFLRAVMLAGLLPDGRGEELATLLDELWRLERPGHVPRRGKVLDFEVGRALPLTESHRGRLERTLEWDIALVASRVGDRAATEEVLAHASRKLLYVSSSPLNGALVFARLGRFADAREVVTTLRRRAASHRSAPPEAEIAGLERQLDAAEAERAPAVRLAGLGAFLAALRTLEENGTLDDAAHAPLVAQLLVACRLDDAARTHVAKHLGPERAQAIVADLAAQLPERLRAMAPVPDRSLAALLEGVQGRSLAVPNDGPK